MAEERRDADPVQAGWAALSKGDWAEARLCFDRALAEAGSPEALEGLGWAGYCLNEARLTLDSREQAYRAYRERGDDASAARVAAWLAEAFLEFRGEPAVANGWLQRAHSLLDGLESGPDHGWLAIIEADIVLAMEEDTDTARRLAVYAIELGRRFGVPELEMVGLGIEGRALVSDGEVGEGMRRLDEATVAALSGEATNLFCVGLACCYLISACERVRDFDRAGQWCGQVGEFCERHGIDNLLGVCRTHHAGVLMWQGRWRDAETELQSAMEVFEESRPPLVGDALVRLAELRRKQGRLDEAEELFSRCGGHSLAVLGRGALALDREEPQDAAELAERFLRRYPDPSRIERCAGLEVAIRAHVALKELGSARDALDMLREIAAQARTRPLQAAVLASEGVVDEAAGDHDSARRSFEDALDLLPPGDAPFENARVRLDLATTLSALGRGDAARRETEAARAIFVELGADFESARAEAMLNRLVGKRAPDASGAPDGPLSELTRRELEVLGLVAEGLTNHEIAERLVLSEHTVHRHVTNILRKLNLPSRAAAASLAGRSGLV